MDPHCLVVGDGGRHRLRVALPAADRVLNVGEQIRDRAAGERRQDAPQSTQEALGAERAGDMAQVPSAPAALLALLTGNREHE